MRHLAFLLIGALSRAVLAGEPSFTCTPDQGCREERGSVYDIGRGAKLSLPFGWRFFSYPTAPDPIMEGLREVRAFKGGMVIAITPMPNIDHRAFSQNQLCDFVVKGEGQYVTKSKEKAVTPVPISRSDLVGCYASLTAEADGEKPFAVLKNRHYASVSTFVVSYKYVIFSVSVVSERLPDEEYLAAVNAIQQIQ